MAGATPSEFTLPPIRVHINQLTIVFLSLSKHHSFFRHHLPAIPHKVITIPLSPYSNSTSRGSMNKLDCAALVSLYLGNLVYAVIFSAFTLSQMIGLCYVKNGIQLHCVYVHIFFIIASVVRHLIYYSS